MNLNITWQILASVTKGKLTSNNPGALFNAFETDSRKIVPNSNFWVLKGEKHDAHSFLPEVIEKGAKGIIIEHGKAAQLTKTPPHILSCDNTLKALQKLAAWRKQEINPKTVCITGTNGKSTSKQMMKAIMELNGKTCANKGNFNNQYGLPLSLLELNPGDELAVFELGASRKGDIAEIAELANPDIGIITNVAAAHLEFFGDVETIYSTKTELKDYIKPGGTLVYNADNDYLKRLKTSYAGKTLTFGFSQGCDFKVMDVNGPLKIEGNGIIYSVNNNFHIHDKLNAAGVCAAAVAMGFSKQSIEQGLSSYEPMPMRMSRVAKEGVDFILDAYNANPLSMEAALNILKNCPQTIKIAVLGDMKELGKYSKQLHKELGQKIAKIKPDAVFLAGPEIEPAYNELKNSGIKVYYALDFNGWLPQLKETVKPGACVLIKASRAMNFDTIITAIN